MPLGVVLVLIGAAYWFLTPNNLPGEAMPQLARDHIADSDPDPTYNSNPPTSGPHSAVWTSAGFYETEKNDRNLIHSLEHGYVVVSYNCSIEQRSAFSVERSAFSVREKTRRYTLFSNTVWAHEESSQSSTMQPEASESGTKDLSPAAGGDPSLPAGGSGQACHELKDYLKDLVKRYGEWKIIAVPRVKNDSRIALTAWGRIDKFNPSPSTGSGSGLGSQDKERIERFVEAWRDKGPEATKD